MAVRNKNYDSEECKFCIFRWDCEKYETECRLEERSSRLWKTKPMGKYDYKGILEKDKKHE